MILKFGLKFFVVICLILSGICISLSGKCQDITSLRFFSLNIQRLSSPNRLISSEGASLKAFDKESNYIIESQLRYPIKLGGRTKVFGQIDFDREVVFGLYGYDETEAEDFNFLSVSHAVVFSHQLNASSSLLSKLKIETGGENIFPLNRDALNINSTNIYQKKINNGKWGIGLQIGHYRTFSVLPIFQLQKRFSTNLSIDIALPQHILINQYLNKSTLIYAGLKGSRSNYYFSNELQDLGEAHYRRVTLNGIIGLEKQLTQLVGLMVEAEQPNL
ncbi:MAG: hypothetical protein RJQ09_11440 [Cyclobacteriaceae bacterium]